MAGRERTDPNCICVGKRDLCSEASAVVFSNLFSVRRANFLIFWKHEFLNVAFSPVLCVLQAVQSLEIINLKLIRAKEGKCSASANLLWPQEEP